MIRLAAGFLPLAFLLFAGCSSEDAPEPGEYGKAVDATFRISATRGTPENPSGAEEKINSWWVAFVRFDGTIAKIMTADLSSSPVEHDEFHIILPTGQYTVVAFANVLPQYVENEGWVYESGSGENSTRLVFNEKSPSPVAFGDTSLWYGAAYQNRDNLSLSPLLPMTGLQTVTVTGRVTEPFSIEVVRQVAKFEIYFKNTSKRPLTVHSYWVEDMSEGPVYLFPKYELLEHAPLLSPLASPLTIARSFTTTLAVDAVSTSDIFYCLESSAASRPHGVYTLKVDLTHHAGEGLEASRDTISALLTDIAYINRNDHIRVPVNLTDYVVKIDVNFYPPIGGYPALIKEVDNSNFYIKFGSIGEFVITPLIREAALGSIPLAISTLQTSITVQNLTEKNIFSRQPAIDPVTGEITGSLSTNTGSAMVTLSFMVPNKGTTVNVVRKLIIVRE